MNRYAFTFGSGQLQQISHKVNPMKVILVIEAGSEQEARDTVFASFISKYFCTSYPESYIKEFEDKYDMKQYNLRELQMMRYPEFRDNNVAMVRLSKEKEKKENK